ncbi:unnamed protein product [Allacma fusca]|uniref:PiggyBac transposable element-derived protein domain-containing protein n=1 Tax=Allacma fusca TaxID=39272 RepID=A0A8J2PWZ7_9HEXA|nr:unnamed protein product [Allacma fusca]
MASSSKQARIQPPQRGLFWDQGDSDSSDEDTSEPEDVMEELTDDEEDELVFRKGEDSEPLEYVDHPTPATFLSPDGTEWSNVIPPSGRRKLINKWTTRPGGQGIRKVVTGVQNAQTLLDVFKLMIQDSMVSEIVKWTNKKANKIIEDWNQQNPTRQPKEWKATDNVEIHALMGLLLLAGAHGMRNMSTRKIWRSDPKYRLHPFIATMGRERFRDLMRFVRFDDYESREERRRMDKLSAIRSFIETLRQNIHSIYEPSEYLVVDEMLIPFRGRCFCRVYMKSKPDRYGLKVWALVDVASNFVLNFQMQPDFEKGNKSRREVLIEKLAEELILPHIRRRSWNGLPRDIQNSILVMGVSPPQQSEAPQTASRGNCYWTKTDGDGNVLERCGKRSRGKCDTCQNWTCQQHGKTVFKCSECSSED